VKDFAARKAEMGKLEKRLTDGVDPEEGPSSDLDTF